MPASQKRKAERASKAEAERASEAETERENRRLSLLHYPFAFAAIVNLEANVDTLVRLIQDAEDDDAKDDTEDEDAKDDGSIACYRETMAVHSAALQIFLPHLCFAEKRKRELDRTTAGEDETEDKAKALQFITSSLKSSLEKAYHFAAIVEVGNPAYRYCLMHETVGGVFHRKVPKHIAMLDVFSDTLHAYRDLEEALKKMKDPALPKRNLPEVLDEVWRCRINQLIHSMIRAQFEELASKFFDDQLSLIHI